LRRKWYQRELIHIQCYITKGSHRWGWQWIFFYLRFDVIHVKNIINFPRYLWIEFTFSCLTLFLHCLTTRYVVQLNKNMTRPQHFFLPLEMPSPNAQGNVGVWVIPPQKIENCVWGQLMIIHVQLRFNAISRVWEYYFAYSNMFVCLKYILRWWPSWIKTFPPSPGVIYFFVAHLTSCQSSRIYFSVLITTVCALNSISMFLLA
jgi:hypothetical protein